VIRNLGVQADEQVEQPYGNERNKESVNHGMLESVMRFIRALARPAFHARRAPLGPRGYDVLAKKTTKNQITLPKAIADRFPNVDYFDVREEEGRIVLVPMPLSRADAVRSKLEALGITEQDVQDAVTWARED